MAGYILLDLVITDPEGFQEYLKLAGPTVKQYGGKVLVGGAVLGASEEKVGSCEKGNNRLGGRRARVRLAAKQASSIRHS